MAKITAIIFALVIAAVSAKAGPAYVGVKLGLNQTTLTETIESEGKSSLTAGLYIEDMLDRHFAFHIEVAYTDRKSNSLEYLYLRDSYQDDYSGGYIVARTTVRTETQFVDLAWLLKVAPSNVEQMIPYVYGGPMVSLLISGSTTVRHVYGEVTHDLESDIGIFSYALGGGFDFDIRGVKTSLDLRMTKALSSIDYQDGGPKRKTNLYSATIGVRLGQR